MYQHERISRAQEERESCKDFMFPYSYHSTMSRICGCNRLFMLVVRGECNEMLQFREKQGKKVGRNYTIGFLPKIVSLPQTDTDLYLSPRWNKENKCIPPRLNNSRFNGASRANRAHRVAEFFLSKLLSLEFRQIRCPAEAGVSIMETCLHL